ncbi:MAG: glycosyltransferase family 39 protein [Caldilineales bacterium]
MFSQHGSQREKWGLACVLAVYVFLALAYSSVNPVFESPDEVYHFGYVEYLLQEHKLPIAALGGSLSEYHQPPLYYLLAAAVSAPAWQADDSSTRSLASTARLESNPFWAYQIGRVGADNKSQYIHSQAEDFPYQDWVLRVHLARWLSILLQSLTIVATYAIAREVFPDRIDIRFGSLPLVAFLPQFLFVSGSVSNDNLIIPLTALLAWLWVRGLRTGIRTRWAAAVGVLTGLAVASKMSGLAMLAFSLAIVLLIGWRARAWKQVVTAWCTVLGLTVVLAGPVMVRNQILYGEPTALRRMSEIWGEHDPALPISEALRQTPNIWTSFWARFGYGQIPVPNAVYFILLGITLVAALGTVYYLVRTHPSPAQTLFWQLLVLIALAAMFFLLVVNYSQVSLTGSNGRFSFPALPAYAILLYVGLSVWVSNARRRVLVGVLYVGMMSFALAVLFVWLRPAYASPPMQVDRPNPTHAANLRFDEFAELIGYDLDPQSVNPGGEVRVTLYWHVLATTDENYTVFVHLFVDGELVQGTRDTYPGLGLLPTSQWEANRYLDDTIPVPIDPKAVNVAPASLQLEVGLYDLNTMQRLPILDASGAPVEAPVIGRLKLAAPPGELAEPLVTSGYRFGNVIGLVGYDVPASGRAGGSLNVDLYWQALATPDRDYTVFLHLLDGDGNIVSQSDVPPLQGRYPTSMWVEPESLVDHQSIQLASDLAPGEYHLIAGLYDPTSGTRLSVQDAEGQAVGDFIDLAIVWLDTQVD